MAEVTESRWLLLLPQIPPRPAYFRVKIWRRLQRLGAVAIKNSVYALPRSEQSQEDFQWVLRDIVEGGGDGSICEARFVDGLTEEQLLGRNTLESEIARLKRRRDEISAIDFFGAPGREAAEGMLASLEGEVRMRIQEKAAAAAKPASKARPEAVRGRTWVTRKGTHVDRIAGAWLIRRFTDPDAQFKFVSAKGYQPDRAELRFDMFEAEFTHEGDRCTFEVLLQMGCIQARGQSHHGRG